MMNLTFLNGIRITGISIISYMYEEFFPDNDIVMEKKIPMLLRPLIEVGRAIIWGEDAKNTIG